MMMKQWWKATLALVLALAMLLAAVPAVFAAEDSFDILYGLKEVPMALHEWGMLYYESADDSVTVTWEAATEGVVEFDTDNNLMHAVGVGSTVVVATASNGQTDRVRVTVREPLTWNGEGTYNVLLNGVFGAATAAFTVPDDGIYEITANSDVMISAEILSEDGTNMAYDVAEGFETGFFTVDRYEAGKTYYIYMFSTDVAYKGGVTFDVSIAKSTAYTKDGVYSVDSSIRTHVGDIIQPQYIVIPSNMDANVRFTTTDTDYLQDNGDGTFTVIDTTPVTDNAYIHMRYDYNGNTVVKNITVDTSANMVTLQRGTQTVYIQDKQVIYNAYAFTADIDHEFTFKCKGGEFVYAQLIGVDGVIDYVDGMAIGDFYMTADMKAGDMVILYVAFLKPEAKIDILVGKTSPPTSLTLSIPAFFCAAKPAADQYLVYNQSGFYLKSDFGTAVGSKALETTYTFSDESIVESAGDGFYGVRGTGTFTATAKTSSGLTDTITITAIDYCAGDINRDGAVDMLDAMAVFQATSGGTALTGASLAIADQNGDAEVDMMDTFTIYNIASGNPPAEPDLSIDSDNTGTIDPTPGDNVEDGDW